MKVIQLSESISLRAIYSDDTSLLKELMHQIYPSSYKHLWEDDGYWYVEETFSRAALEKELAESNASYYFVEYQNETVGVLRIVYDFLLSDMSNLKATKLHRIYLDPKTQGKGIGKFLMDWAAQEALKNDSKIIWLEVMDTQEQALLFYKKLGYVISSDFRLTFELMYEHLRGMHRMYFKL